MYVALLLYDCYMYERLDSELKGKRGALDSSKKNDLERMI